MAIAVIVVAAVVAVVAVVAVNRVFLDEHPIRNGSPLVLLG